MLELFSRFTITLIRLKEDTKSKVRMTPSSRKCACYELTNNMKEVQISIDKLMLYLRIPFESVLNSKGSASRRTDNRLH